MKERRCFKDPRTYVIDLGERSKIEGLRQCHVFDRLLFEEMRELASLATPVVFPRGAFIFKEGDPPAFFYVVCEGLVQVFKTSRSGKNVTLAIAGRGETLVTSALFLDSHSVSSKAMNDVTLLRIEAKEWLAFVSSHPAVRMEIIALLAHRLNGEYERIVDIVGEEVELRLVHSLSILAVKFGLTLFLTREELASCAGTTTETTIRVLSKLRKRGLIVGSATHSEIVISDLTRLQNYVL